MSKKFRSKDAYALTRPGAKVTMRLPANCRFMIVVAGSAPTVLPITEAGNWEIDIPPEVLPTVAEWPVLVMILPEKHVAMFERIKPEMATDMVRQARSSYASGAN